jgi:hypothetical protein
MAPGSHATWEGMPRVCAGCGQELPIGGQDAALWLNTMHRQSWHIACKLETLNRRHAA